MMTNAKAAPEVAEQKKDFQKGPGENTAADLSINTLDDNRIFAKSKPAGNNNAETIDFSVARNIYGRGPEEKIVLATMNSSDRPNTPPDKVADMKSDLQKRRDQTDALTKRAEQEFKGNPASLAEFKENMKHFEAGAKKNGLSNDEITKTYQQLDRLLSAKGDQPLSGQRRDLLAEQIIRQAANPTKIDQGQHNTCSMASVEARMYTRNPSDAARLVTDVALTGHYTNSDGMRVTINPGPHGESRSRKTADGDRTHASEIFQVTSANLHIEMLNRSTEPKGQLRYEQHPTTPGSSGTGEHIIDYGVKPPKLLENDPRINEENMGNLRDVYTSITGKPENHIVVAREREGLDPSDGIKRVNSEKEFHDVLAQAKKHGKFPLLLSVDGNMEPFWTDSGGGAAGGSGGRHMVTVTDFKAGPPGQVAVDNQWGKEGDYSISKPISVHELYSTMGSNEQAIAILEPDVKAARKAGHPDTFKELDLARLKLQTELISPQDYEKEIGRLARDAAKAPPGAIRDRLKNKLENDMTGLEPAAGLRVLRIQKAAGLLTKDEFDDSLVMEVGKMLEIRHETKRAGQWRSEGKAIFDSGVKELMETLKGYTPEQIKAVRNALK